MNTKSGDTEASWIPQMYWHNPGAKLLFLRGFISTGMCQAIKGVVLLELRKYPNDTDSWFKNWGEFMKGLTSWYL